MRKRINIYYTVVLLICLTLLSVYNIKQTVNKSNNEKVETTASITTTSDTSDETSTTELSTSTTSETSENTTAGTTTTITTTKKKEVVTQVKTQPTSTTTTSKTQATTKPSSNSYELYCKITHYCPCTTCNGSSSGLTASGTKLKPYYTVAVDKNVIPLGSKVVINGKTYIAEDTGVRGNVIDVCVGSHSEAYNKGVYYTTVTVYK